MNALFSRRTITPGTKPAFILLFLFTAALSFGMANISTITATAAATTPVEPTTLGKTNIVAGYGKLPLSFEANRGQMDAQVQFVSRGQGYTLFLTSREAVLSLSKPGARHRSPAAGRQPESAAVASDAANAVVRMQMVGGNRRPLITQEDELPGKSNYFIGNDPDKWRSNVPNYARIRYREVYPGIDLVYYGNQRRVEHDFIVAPGADPSRISFRLRGVSKLRLDAGDLVMQTAQGELRLLKPEIYQIVEGERREVAGRYVLAGGNKVGFEIAVFDRRQPLVIDPILSYSTYLGGSDAEEGKGIALDSSGNVYVTGYTLSTDFPTKNPYQNTNHGAFLANNVAFVTKLAADGQSLVYSTYLGGSGGDSVERIAVDSNGNAYITGGTSSPDFPIVNAIPGSSFYISGDSFVTKLSTSGSSLVYSTYLGGTNGSSYTYDIAVDSSGNAYVTGYTYSTDFPTKNPYQSSNRDATDRNAFITKLAPNTGSSAVSLVYSTYLGGSGSGMGGDWGNTIAVDSSGNIYVAGSAFSSDFPLKNAYQSSNHGAGNTPVVFVSKLKADGSDLVYSTFLGGNGGSGPFGDHATGIAVDSSGSAYVAGYTTSTDFPTKNPYQSTNKGLGSNPVAFVTKFKADGSDLVYSTYLGGSSRDFGNGIAVDSGGYAHVVGSTRSADFPTRNALQSSLTGIFNAFITKLSMDGTALVYSTYLGGTNGDGANGIALDSSGNAYVTGGTSSTDFPTKNPYQASYKGGDSDVFIAKLAPDDFTVTVNPGSLSIPWGQSGSVQLTITPQNGFNQTISFTCSGLPAGATCSFLPPTLTPNVGAVTTTLTITTTVTAKQRRNRHLPWTATSVMLAICSLGIGVRRSPKLTCLMLLALAMAATGLLIGCGGGFATATGSSTNSTPVSSNIAVTASGGFLQHQTTVGLTIH